MQRLSIAFGVGALLGALMVLLAGKLSPASTDADAVMIAMLTTEAIENAEEVDSTRSALDALHRGDAQVAIQTLQTQLQAKLLILYTTRSKLASRGKLSTQEKQMIDQVISDAEKYSQAHNLKIYRVPAEKVTN